MLEPTLVLLATVGEAPGEPSGLSLRHGDELPVMPYGSFSVCFKAHFCAVDTRPRRRAVARRRFRSWPDVYELSKKLHRVVSSLPVRLGPIFIAAPQRGQRLVGLEAVSV
jgi:hypothetical protein